MALSGLLCFTFSTTILNLLCLAWFHPTTGTEATMYAGQTALCRGYDGCQTGMLRTSASTLFFSKHMKIGIDCIANSFLDASCMI